MINPNDANWDKVKSWFNSVDYVTKLNWWEKYYNLIETRIYDSPETIENEFIQNVDDLGMLVWAEKSDLPDYIDITPDNQKDFEIYFERFRDQYYSYFPDLNPVEFIPNLIEGIKSSIDADKYRDLVIDKIRKQNNYDLDNIEHIRMKKSAAFGEESAYLGIETPNFFDILFLSEGMSGKTWSISHVIEGYLEGYANAHYFSILKDYPNSSINLDNTDSKSNRINSATAQQVTILFQYIFRELNAKINHTEWSKIISYFTNISDNNIRTKLSGMAQKTYLDDLILVRNFLEKIELHSIVEKLNNEISNKSK